MDAMQQAACLIDNQSPVIANPFVFNLYKPGVSYVGHRQTVQTQISAASDQDFHYLLTGTSITNRTHMKNTPDTP